MDAKTLKDHCGAIEVLTENNCHNEARYYIAKEVLPARDVKLIELFEHLMRMHLLIGFMPHGLIDTRDWLTNERLRPLMEQQFSKEEFDELWGCL